MAKTLTPGEPLCFQINCRVGEADYLSTVKESEAQNLSQAALVRMALKEYLQHQQAETMNYSAA